MTHAPRTFMFTLLGLGLLSAADAQTRTITSAQLRELLESASRIDLYSTYLRVPAVERALVQANQSNGAQLNVVTTRASLLGPADMFANLKYATLNTANFSEGSTLRIAPQQPEAFMIVNSQYLVTGEFGLPGRPLRVTTDRAALNRAGQWFGSAYRAPAVSSQQLYNWQYLTANPSAKNARDLETSFKKFATPPVLKDLKTAEEILKENQPKR